MRIKPTEYTVYQKDLLTGDVHVFEHILKNRARRIMGLPDMLEITACTEYHPPYERYVYICIENGGEYDNERKNQLFAGW